jgi:hypothetical protein
MAEFTNYAETKIYDHMLRNTAWTSPVTVYVALHTADPTETGAVAEISGNGYIRKAAAFAASTDGVGSTSGDVTYDQATGDWGTISHFSIWDAESAGNALMYSSVTTPKAVNSGDTAKFTAGDITVTIA